MAIVKEKKITRLDGRIVTEISMHRPKKRGIKAGDRKGFNSRSGMASMLDPDLAEIEKPTVDKVAPLITKLRIIGDISASDQPKDVLTAQGHALYEFLMAAARIQGIEKDEYRVLLTDAKKFLGIKHNDRLRALARQLQDTTVEYDFTVDGQRWQGLRMPLQLIDYVTPERDGKTYLVYSIQPRVKRVITESNQWAKLDINAYPKFQCKYTPRLYPRFQLISQYHEAQRNNLIVTPVELARWAGFIYSGDFHYGNFEKGLLKPVLKDIETHAFMLSVQVVKVHRKPGRGNPVDKIEFCCEPRTYLRPIGDEKMQKVSPDQFDLMTKQLYKDDTVLAEDMPSHSLILKAAYRLKKTPFELVKMWKEDIAKAYAYPSMELQFGLKGECICDLLERKGGAAAFEFWAGHLDIPLEPIWAETEKQWDQKQGLIQTVEKPESNGYTMTVLKRTPQATAYSSDLESIIADLRSVSSANAQDADVATRVKSYCSLQHPAIRDRLRSLIARVGDDFELIEDAMAHAASEEPDPMHRRNFILSVFNWANSFQGDKSDRALVDRARAFEKKCRLG